jgi:ribosome-binding protein aMBF1 (putative translation factor)
MSPKEIRSRRLALGMSVEELARELGLSADVVRAMESGDQPVAGRRLLQQTFARREREHREQE